MVGMGAEWSCSFLMFHKANLLIGAVGRTSKAVRSFDLGGRKQS